MQSSAHIGANDKQDGDEPATGDDRSDERPAHVRYVKWHRESGDLVGDTSQKSGAFRIERRIHGTYLVIGSVRETVKGTTVAKLKADILAESWGCAPVR